MLNVRAACWLTWVRCKCCHCRQLHQDVVMPVCVSPYSVQLWQLVNSRLWLVQLWVIFSQSRHCWCIWICTRNCRCHWQQIVAA